MGELEAWIAEAQAKLDKPHQMDVYLPPDFYDVHLTKALTLLHAAQQVVEAAEDAEDFGISWAQEHQCNDHLVTLDHKDEMELSDLVANLCRALATYHQTVRAGG